MKNLKTTKDKFIENANIKHNYNFDYSLINIFNHKNKVTINCKIHNTLIDILPYNHLVQINGGCKECEKIKKDIKLENNEIKKSVNIDEYKDNYWITNFGRCFSKKTNKELKTHINGGYKKVNLYKKNHENIIYTLHILVYITFQNNYDTNKVIDHINGNKLDNNINNLRCISESENVKNAYKNNNKMYQQKIIQAFDKENNLIKEFNTIEEAKIFINHKNTCSIGQCLRGKYNSSGGYIWKYKDDNNSYKNKFIEIIDEYKTIGIIDNLDFSNYKINKNGEIINTNYNNRKVKCFGDKEYFTVYLFYEEKKKKSFRLHRLLSKIFLKNGDKYYNDKNYVVNHKDKNKRNNNINNLEWITSKENTIHGRGKKIAQINIETNEIIKIFKTITNAYEELGKPWNSLISKVCLGQKGRNSIYGYKWKYIEE